MSLWGIPTKRLTCCFIVLLSILLILVVLKSGSISVRLRAEKRVGPHNHDIMSIIYGSLLGDAHAEQRAAGNGTRISFYQESSHSEYLLWLHGLIMNLGYCSLNVPKIALRIAPNGNIRYIIRFSTFTYSSFNFVHDAWYTNGVKHVPHNIGNFLTSLTLAIWIMDDGGWVGYGLKFATNSFTHEDCTLLVQTLRNLYGIKAEVQSAGVPNQYCVYVWSHSMPTLRNIVRPHLVPSMLYKIGE